MNRRNQSVVHPTRIQLSDRDIEIHLIGYFTGHVLVGRFHARPFLPINVAVGEGSDRESPLADPGPLLKSSKAGGDHHCC